MGENSGHHKLVLSPDEKDAEKEFQENDACLKSTLPRRNDTFRERIQNKFACLGLTWTGLLILLCFCVVILIFLITIIVLAVKLALYAKYTSNICKTPECLRTSANIIQMMNRDVEPCEDFFEFSCGSWIRDEKNGYGVTTRGKETRMDQHLREYYSRVREILNTRSSLSNVTSIEWKMKSFYESCMNMDNIEAANIHPLKRIIDQLYGWHVLRDQVVSQWDSNNILRRLHVEFGVNPFFRPVVSIDRVATIKIVPSGLGLPYKKLYFRPTFDRVVEAYKQLMHDIAVNFGATGPTAKKFADDTFYFERRLASIYPDVDHRTQLRYPEELTTVSELNAWSPQIFWTEYLNLAFQGYPIPATARIYANRTYLKEVSSLFSSTDDSIMNNYMIWTLVRHYTPYLSHKFQVILANFQKALTGSSRSVSRWEFCIKEVEKLFPVGLGALYVDTYMPQDIIKNVHSYYDELVKTLVDRLYGYDWMDEKSRQMTRQKIESLSLYQKFPAQVNSTKMVKHYMNLIILKSDFFQNIIKGVDFQNLLAVRWLKDQPNFTNANSQANFDWHKSHYFHQLDPYVTLSRRHMVTPFYLLHEPIFDANQLPGLNFGSFGWLLGRALVQGFEDADIVNTNWSKPTFSPSWWTNYTWQVYEYHQKCLVNEYSKYTEYKEHSKGNIEEVYFDPNSTEDENMADIGGLTLAYHGFINWVSDHNEDKLLPAIADYSKEQLFFISFGQSLCSESRPESLSNELDGSKFSPNRIRVNGAVSHIPEFSEAFDCSYSSNMNSEHKCTTW